MRMLVSGDWHLRLSVPRCRNQSEEEWLEHQRNTIKFIILQANKRKANLFINGDIFDKPIAHPSVVNMLIEELSHIEEKVYIGYGNHDLLARSKDVSKVSYGVLDRMTGSTPWLDKIEDKQAWVPYDEETPIGKGDVVFLHTLTVEKMEDAKFFEAKSARELLIQYDSFDWIVTSDNHKAFTVEHKGRRLFNPGCITKQSASYKDSKLLVYFVDTHTAEWEPVFLPEDNEVVDDSYLTDEKERDERLGAFVESLKAGGELSLSFRDNVNQVLQSIQDRDTVNMIKELMEV